MNMRIPLSLLFLVLCMQHITAQCDSTYVFCDQTDIDSFQVWYGPCERVHSIAFDSNCTISNLDGLSGIKWINNLYILEGTVDHLTSLSGLDSLERITTLYYSTSKQFEPFPVLNRTSRLIYTFSGENRDLSVLKNVKTVLWAIISGDGQLSGMESFTPDDRTLIDINGNHIADDLSGLFKNPLDSLSGISFFDCSGIDISALNMIQSCGNLSVTNCDSIDFSVVDSMSQLGSLHIKGDNSSCNLTDAFNNISRVGYINIEETESIETIEQLLPDLEHIAYGLRVVSNASFNSLDFVSQFELPITPTPFRSFLFPDYVEVVNNPLLEDCANNYICRVIIEHPDSTTIEDNGFSCNEEYLSGEGCLTSTVDENEGKVPYPNPVHNIVNIHTSDGHYRIYNMHGAVIQSGNLNHGQLDVSNLNSGVYYLEVEGSTSSWRHRILKL